MTVHRSITQTETDEWTIPQPKTTPAPTTYALLPKECTPAHFESLLETVGVEFRYNYRSLRTQYRRIPFR